MDFHSSNFYFKPIGVINSKFGNTNQTPRQGRNSNEISEIVIFEEYQEGLQDLDKYKHLIILYWQDRSARNKLKVIPPGQTKKRGVFSTRSPSRPNPIAFCLVEVIEIKENRLKVKWLDALNGSPVMDIKPFISDLDCID
jgi:tRNA (adenine37-N6)-methyltransferase